MKKFGFTMAELLITLGVIAVVAAITAPALENLFPDRNKAKVLKVYKVISDINEEILNDPSLYMQERIYKDTNIYKRCPENEENYSCFDCDGMNCVQPPSDTVIKDKYNFTSYYSSNLKYPYLLYDRLNTTEDSYTVSDWTISNIRTLDNVEWSITGYAPHDNNDSNNHNALCIITINVEPDSNENNCGLFNTIDCKKPTSFRFRVDNNGKVGADDEDTLTKAYLMNPTKLNDKKHDYACAANPANCVQ